MRVVQRKRVLRIFPAQTIHSLVGCQKRQQPVSICIQRLQGLSVISILTPTSAQSFTTTKDTICPSYGLCVDLCPAPGVPHELGTLGAKVINFNEHPGQQGFGRESAYS